MEMKHSRFVKAVLEFIDRGLIVHTQPDDEVLFSQKVNCASAGLLQAERALYFTELQQDCLNVHYNLIQNFQSDTLYFLHSCQQAKTLNTGIHFHTLFG